ncbi:MAG TPA: TPM domain-containing protein [Burkholderiales bacterium]|nr:TPM domain-containing protein [Burkholderiales bacterium]
MTQLPLRRAALALVLLLAWAAAIAQVAVPPLTARVTDVTGTLSAEQRARLEDRLAAFETRKGTQLAVLIVPTTQPEAIEQFGIRVAEQWKVGRKGVDDGAILIIALKDRELRIEVGYGLEGALTDATANRIIDEFIVPHFKQGDFYGGIDAGLSRMMAVIEGEELPPPARGSGGPQGGGWEQFAVIAFLLVFVVGGIVRAIFGRFLGSGIIAGLAGFAAWLMIGSLIAAIAICVIAWLLSLMGGMAGLPSARRGGWYSGGPMGGWGGGGGGGGGGWSGGGGGFGGGGASGRW